MESKTFEKCLEISDSFKEKYGISVSSTVFKDVMVYTLHKISRIRKQIEGYTTVNEYIPLLFEDCLYEHYMFSSVSNKINGGVVIERAVV